MLSYSPLPSLPGPPAGTSRSHQLRVTARFVPPASIPAASWKTSSGLRRASAVEAWFRRAQPRLCLRRRSDGGQLRLHLVRVRVRGPAEPLRQAKHVCINADSRDPEGVTEENVGGLPSHPVQRQEVLESVGDLAAVAIQELLAAELQG